MKIKVKRIPFVDPFLIKKFLKNKEKKDIILTKSRRSTILPSMIGYQVGVYNGKVFKNFTITASMVGYKLGNFSLTRQMIKGHVKPASEKAKTKGKQ